VHPACGTPKAGSAVSDEAAITLGLYRFYGLVIVLGFVGKKLATMTASGITGPVFAAPAHLAAQNRSASGRSSYRRRVSIRSPHPQ
jgi:hypothetical protein